MEMYWSKWEYDNPNCNKASIGYEFMEELCKLHGSRGIMNENREWYEQQLYVDLYIELSKGNIRAFEIDNYL